MAVVVKSGTLTLYDSADQSCTPQRYSAGQGFVDPVEPCPSRPQRRQQAGGGTRHLPRAQARRQPRRPVEQPRELSVLARGGGRTARPSTTRLSAEPRRRSPGLASLSPRSRCSLSPTPHIKTHPEIPPLLPACSPLRGSTARSRLPHDDGMRFPDLDCASDDDRLRVRPLLGRTNAASRWPRAPCAPAGARGAAAHAPRRRRSRACGSRTVIEALRPVFASGVPCRPSSHA